MTRLCKIKGFNGFIGGKDNDNIFEEGVVYEVKKLMGQIILTPIGNQPIRDGNGDEILMQNLSQIISKGDYLLPEIEENE